MLKLINDRYYIHKLLNSLSREKDIPVSVNVKNQKYLSKMSFSYGRLKELCISIDKFGCEISDNDTVTVSFFLKEVLFVFKSKIIERLPSSYILSKPQVVKTSFKRHLNRYKTCEDENICVSFSGDERIFKITDISTKGLSFICSEKILYSGEEKNKVRLMLNETDSFYIDMLVKHCWQQDDGLFVYGLFFKEIDHNAASFLFNYIFERTNAELKNICFFDNYELLSFYNASQEMSLISKKFDKEEFLEVVKNFKKINNPLLSSSFVQIKNNRLLNIGSVLRLYNNTFLIEDLISTSDSILNVKANDRMKINIYDYLLSNSYLKYAIQYITSDFELNKEEPLSINRFINSKEKFVLDTLICYELSINNNSDYMEDEAYICKKANNLDRFIEFCERKLSKQDIEAYDYKKEKFELTLLAQVYDTNGLFAKRSLYYIYNQENIVAYAVAECFSDETNINNIIGSMCRVFVENNIQIENIVKALIPRLIEFYGRYFKEKCYICFEHNALKSYIVLDSLKYYGKIGRILMNHDGLANYKGLLIANSDYHTVYYPLSHSQKSVWKMQTLYPETSIANIAVTLKIEDTINNNLFERAINLFIEKNDGIRLHIIDEDETPKQYVVDYEYKKIDFYDFSSYQLNDFYEWEKKKSIEPLNLIDNDLYYFALIKISSNEYRFYIKVHHLIADIWCINLIIYQVIDIYYKLQNNEIVYINQKPSYIDYVIGEDEYKYTDKFVKSKQFWQEKFQTVPQCNYIKERPKKFSSIKSQRKTFVIAGELARDIDDYCLKSKISISKLFTAIMILYVNKMSSKEDIVIGLPILNRSNIKEKVTFGMFAGIIPFRLYIETDISFSKYVEKVSKEMDECFNYQKYSHDLIQKDFREKHKLNKNIHDIFVSYQNAKLDIKSNIKEYKSWLHYRDSQVEQLIWSINDWEEKNEYIINIDYLCELFTENEIEKIFECFMILLKESTGNSNKRLEEIKLLRDESKEVIDFSRIPNNLDIIEKIINIRPSRVYILNKYLNFLPIGAEGNVLIETDKKIVGFNEENNLLNNSNYLYKTEISALWNQEGEIELKNKNENISIIISATFTANPMVDYIGWWCNKFGFSTKINIVVNNQIFQNLLDKESVLNKNKYGINIILVRFEDFIRDSNQTEEIKINNLEQIFNELKEALENYKAQTPLISVIFPISSHIGLSDVITAKIQELNERYKEIFSNCKNIFTIDLHNASEIYCVKEVFDRLKDMEGHMPFTEEYYAVIGTEIARKICAIKKQIFKVIVLDCDNTLWRGICGEVGASGVKVDKPYKDLQSFILEKYNEGTILAICSKNNEKDVIDVFENNPDMIIKKEHILCWKVNWQEKSNNIKEIAKEINLGLDSFIFIDDNPIECSKMVENCPQVLTLQLPNEEDYIPIFLKHIWAFDKVKVTKEDILRNIMYKSEQERTNFKNIHISFDDFLRNLNLKVSMRLINLFEMERAAQLTYRTNQFNLSTIRRTEEQILGLMKDLNTKCFVIEAIDRFGDYGIVGLVILIEEDKKIFIDTLLLSCRILGKKVENVILCGIRKFMQEKESLEITAKYVFSEKNKLIYDFFESTNWKITKKR